MTTFRTLLASLALLVALLPAARQARATQSHDNCTGFIDTLPVVISTQGVWCLRQDLATSMASGNAIEIAGNNITIDCNDFNLDGLPAGSGSLATGIFADTRQNATVRHCTLHGFFHGIDLNGGGGHLVEDNHLDNSLYTGITVYGGNNLVRRNRVFDTGGATGYDSAWGIVAFGDIYDNTVDGASASASDTFIYGIRMAGVGSVARGNRVRGLVAAGSGDAYGIYASSADITLDRNRIIASATTAGIGIYGYANTVCSGNVATNFATNYWSCAASTGDVSLP